MLLLLILLLLPSSTPLNILIYNPKYALSRVWILGRMADELVMRGHNVTTLMPIIKDNMNNEGTTLSTIIHVPPVQAAKEYAQYIDTTLADNFWNENTDNPSQLIEMTDVVSEIEHLSICSSQPEDVVPSHVTRSATARGSIPGRPSRRPTNYRRLRERVYPNRGCEKRMRLKPDKCIPSLDMCDRPAYEAFIYAARPGKNIRENELNELEKNLKTLPKISWFARTSFYVKRVCDAMEKHTGRRRSLSLPHTIPIACPNMCKPPVQNAYRGETPPQMEEVIRMRSELDKELCKGGKRWRIGDTFKGRVAAAYAPDHFYVHNEHVQKLLGELQTQISTELSSSPSQCSWDEVCAGKEFAVRGPAGEWRRVRVVKRQHNTDGQPGYNFRVYCVDTGENMVVNECPVELPEPCSRLPSVAIRCAYYTDMSHEEWESLCGVAGVAPPRHKFVVVGVEDTHIVVCVGRVSRTSSALFCDDILCPGGCQRGKNLRRAACNQ